MFEMARSLAVVAAAGRWQAGDCQTEYLRPRQSPGGGEADRTSPAQSTQLVSSPVLKTCFKDAYC